MCVKIWVLSFCVVYRRLVSVKTFSVIHDSDQSVCIKLYSEHSAIGYSSTYYICNALSMYFQQATIRQRYWSVWWMTLLNTAQTTYFFKTSCFWWLKSIWFYTGCLMDDFIKYCINNILFQDIMFLMTEIYTDSTLYCQWSTGSNGVQLCNIVIWKETLLTPLLW